MKPCKLLLDKYEYRQNKYMYLIAAAALVAGFFFRFWDLGGAPLAIDEYFLGTSTLNTGKYGLPQFACGGHYTRGLLIQYLSIPLLALGASLEFTVRFWPAVASILSILAVWRIALLVGGPRTALIAVVLMSMPVVAQEPSYTMSELESRCEAADEELREACLLVLYTVLIPEAGKSILDIESRDATSSQAIPTLSEPLSEQQLMWCVDNFTDVLFAAMELGLAGSADAPLDEYLSTLAMDSLRENVGEQAAAFQWADEEPESFFVSCQAAIDVR